MRIISNEELHIVAGGEGLDFLADRFDDWGAGGGGGKIGQIDYLAPALIPAAAGLWGGHMPAYSMCAVQISRL